MVAIQLPFTNHRCSSQCNLKLARSSTVSAWSLNLGGLKRWRILRKLLLKFLLNIGVQYCSMGFREFQGYDSYDLQFAFTYIVPADAGLYRLNMLKSTIFDIKISGYRMHTLLLPSVLLISLGMSESFSGLCCRQMSSSMCWQRCSMEENSLQSAGALGPQ